MSSNESYPQYVVTAVIVAHDGATWLPNVADALLGQTRAVQRVVAVDTGSRDRGGAVLASKFGQAAVFGMDRATGYGAAVARALTHRAANLPVPGASGSQQGDRVEWIWLLHDDCEPAPDALEQLLRGAAETNSAAVLGPKLRDWSNREVILEAGITLDTAARRLTGIEPREVDQGQHDGDRDALAVSSAGMLVRRDVWEQVGGFDVGMGLFMEDIDFCWRVHSAGYRVRVITDAICYHALAATRRRRAISVGRRARMLDRRNGLLTLLGNLPFSQMATAAVGNVVVSLLRIAFFLVGKRLTAAIDEAAATTSVLFHPIRLITMRSRRARGRRAAYTRVKADLPPGRSLRRLAEFAASAMSKSAQTDTTGAHHASADPAEDDSMLVDIGLGKRLLTSPTLLTLIALLAVAIVACRSLLGSGPLGGGSLIPAWGGASDLWGAYLQSFHPSGLGSSVVAPSYVGVLATLSTVLLGKPWLAIDVLLIGCVPLAGMSAMLAIRRLTSSAVIRVWASLTYALLPVATGVIATGRFGSAVAFVLLPLIALAAGRVVAQPGQQASRAAWATGLLVAIGAAFVPLLWLVVLAACVVTAVVLRNNRPGLLRNLAIVAFTPPILLLPWTLTLISHPSALLLEAGLAQPGTPPSGLSGKMLILLDPGGPGLPPYWVTGGLLAVAFAALFAGRRRKLITAGWGVALAGMLLAIVTSHLVVTPPDGGKVVVWAGLPLAIAALGLLLAASIGAEALSRMVAGRKGLSGSLGTGKGMVAGLIALVGCSAPALAAASWLSTGVSGPIHQVTSQVVPELVAVADGQSRQVRTLVLRSDHGRVSYLLLRGPSPSLADAALSSPPSAQQALTGVVAALTTPGGGLAVNQSQLLADFDIGFVLVEAPIDQQLTGLLDDVSGLRPYSTTASYAIWQLITPPARVTVIEPNGTVVPVASGQVGVSGAPVPAAGGTLMLAEPEGGWSASVNGKSLLPAPSPAGSWAQAFTLPPGGGTLSLSHSGLIHDAWLIFEALALLAVIGLALPGIHLSEESQRTDTAAAAQPAGRTGPAAEQRDGRVPVATGSGSRAAAASGAGAATRSGASRAAGGRAAAGRRAALAGAAGLAASRAGRGAGKSRAKAKSGRGKPSRRREAGDARPDLDRAGRARPDDSALAGSGRDDAAGRQRTARYADDRDRQDSQQGRRARRAVDDSQPIAADTDRADSRSRPSAGAGDRPAARSSRASGPQSRAWPYQDDSAPAGGAADWPSRDAIGRSRADQRPPSGSGEWDRPTGRPTGRSPSGSAPPPQWSSQSAEHRVPSQPDRRELDRYDSGRDRQERFELERYDRRDGARHGRNEPDSYQPARYERDDYQPSRYEREPREADDYGSRQTRRYERPRDEPDRYQSSHRDEPDQDERPSRWGRRHRDDRSAGTRVARLRTRQSDSQAQADPLSGAGWPGAGGDSLEPLPPITGRPQGGSHRAAAWRPDARSARSGRDGYAEPSHPYEQRGDWDDDDRGDRRWSSAEADYEGDTW
ncbi:MAG TPA: glycosyltransferase [Streptosporangiaceae bacterium]|nr:glycosyltransferase [Streptosporangiaceae bacterium]